MVHRRKNVFNNVKLGIAPIGWTNDDMPQLGGELTFEQMISEAALAGFQGTEIGGKFPTDPVVLNRALNLFSFALIPATSPLQRKTPMPRPVSSVRESDMCT